MSSIIYNTLFHINTNILALTAIAPLLLSTSSNAFESDSAEPQQTSQFIQTTSTGNTLPESRNEIDNQLGFSQHSNSISFGQVEFNLTNRVTTKSIRSNINHHKAKTHSQSFTIANWNQQYLPILNGHPIKVNGKSLTISINKDETAFFIITDKERALITNNGKVIWKRPIQLIASEAVISSDQLHIIVRYNNDIVRWYNYESGEEVFSLFVQPKTMRWIIWSPEGYYDNSDPDFGPVVIERKNTNHLSLIQQRYYLFRPDIIQQIMSNEWQSKVSAATLPKQSIAPTISLLNDEYNSNDEFMNFCIKSSSNNLVSITFAVNGAVVQRRTTSAANNVRNNECSHIVSYKKIKSDMNYILTTRAFDLENKIWSVKDEQSIPESSESFEKDKTSIIFIGDNTNTSANVRNIKLLADYFKNTEIHQLNDKQNNTAKKNINNTKTKQTDSFILYLSALCNVSDNDILFNLDNNTKRHMTLSRLKKNLQATNSPNSLILIDCHIKDKAFDNARVKKYIHDFMFETGRNVLVQLSPSTKKQSTAINMSYMMTTLGMAVQGEADQDDNLSITSNELMDYMIKTLPEVTFEGSGDPGIIFSQKNHNNSFKLPVLLEE